MRVRSGKAVGREGMLLHLNCHVSSWQLLFCGNAAMTTSVGR